MNEFTGESEIIATPTSKLIPVSDYLQKTDPEHRSALLQSLDTIKGVFGDIQARTGTMDMLVYAAGGHDAYPILLTDNLVIMDYSPFAPEHTSSDYEFALQAARAQDNPLQAFPIRNTIDGNDLLNHHNFKELQETAIISFRQYADLGFSYGDLPYKMSRILGQLYMLGIDPTDVALQGVKGGFKLIFDLDGQRKTIYYATITLSHYGRTDEGYPEAREFLNTTESEINPGTKGFLEKADYWGVGAKLLRTSNPDWIIFDDMSYFRDIAGALDEFDLERLSENPTKYEGVKLGYQDNAGDILIGKRKRQTPG